MKLVLLMALLVASPLLADTVTFTLYAVPENSIPVKTEAEGTIVDYLVKKGKEGRIFTDSQDLHWGSEGQCAGETTKVEYPTEFGPGDQGKLIVEGMSVQELGYKIKWESSKQGEAGDLKLEFSWKPSMSKRPISSKDRGVWTSHFKKISCAQGLHLKPDETTLAARWRFEHPISSDDEGEPRLVFLLVRWSE